jgi:predicted lipid-binding transport protein (Tim44 family)
MPGVHVTTLFGSTEIKPKPKGSLLPLLTVLFLISYGLMTLLIVEQGSTIQSQRTMIQQLLGDSTELAHLKGKIVREQEAATAAQPPSTQASPSRKIPKEPPARKARRPAPEKPAQPAGDLVDVRRNLHSI